MICSIIDVTGFVKQQKSIIDKGEIERLEVPKEMVYEPVNSHIRKQIGLDQ